MSSPQTAVEPRLIGQYLPCSPADIERALTVQAQERASGNSKSIGEILVSRETVTHETLRAALEIQRTDRLRQSSLLASLSKEDLARVSGITEEICLATGEVLFRQGHHGDSIYVVTSGRILMSQQQTRGGERPVAVALPGDVLGERSYLNKRPRACSAWAIEPAMLLKIRYELLSSVAHVLSELSFKHRSLLTGPPAGADVRAWIGNLTANIAHSVCRALRVENAFVFIRDSDARHFVSYIEGDGEYRQFRVRPGSGIVGAVAQTGELIKLAEAYSDRRFTTEIDVWTEGWTRTLMAGPVRNADEVLVGVLQVINKTTGRFDQDDETVFRAVSNQYASTVELCATHLKGLEGLRE